MNRNKIIIWVLLIIGYATILTQPIKAMDDSSEYKSEALAYFLRDYLDKNKTSIAIILAVCAYGFTQVGSYILPKSICSLEPPFPASILSTILQKWAGC